MNLYIPSKLWTLLWALVDVCDIEFQLFLVIKKINNRLTVTDFVMPKQVCHSSETECTPEDIVLACQDVNMEDIKCWLHSHVNMPTSPSGTDTDQAKEYMANAQWFFTCIVNKKLEYTMYFHFADNQVLAKFVQIADPEVAEYAKKLIAENVSHKSQWSSKSQYSTLFNAAYAGDDDDEFAFFSLLEHLCMDYPINSPLLDRRFWDPLVKNYAANTEDTWLPSSGSMSGVYLLPTIDETKFVMAFPRCVDACLLNTCNYSLKKKIIQDSIDEAEHLADATFNDAMQEKLLEQTTVAQLANILAYYLGYIRDDDSIMLFAATLWIAISRAEKEIYNGPVETTGDNRPKQTTVSNSNRSGSNRLSTDTGTGKGRDRKGRSL